VRISIITLALDLPPYLQEAIDSVEHHPAFDLEHIIVHDGDDAVTGALRQKYPAIKVLKGRAAGATTAAAIGVEAASGDFILFLHSDDRLCPGVLARLAERAAARPDVKIWTGGTRIFYTAPHGNELTARWITDRDLTRLSLENICDATPLLSARFCRRSVFAEIGNFDPKFSESSDREILLRAIIAGIPEAALDVMASEMRMHEGSRTLHGRRGAVPPYLLEHVAIADMWRGRPGVDVRTRR
jgi:glycosyltransferase involved in cell wall biosynthesis